MIICQKVIIMIYLVIIVKKSYPPILQITYTL